MHIYQKILYLGVITFLCAFSTIAVAQHLFTASPTIMREATTLKNSGFRELPVFFPQGRLYCGDGTLAYQKLYPPGWQKLTNKEAVTLAVHSVDESCATASLELCKEHRARLSKLRSAIRTCF